MSKEREKFEISTRSAGDPIPEIEVPAEGVKSCSTCERPFPLHPHFWHRDPSSDDGFRNECKVCRKQKTDAGKEEDEQKDELVSAKKDFDKRFLKFVEEIPTVPEVDAVPHSTLLYERMVHYFGGADGIARHLSMVYLSGSPAIRSRILGLIVNLGVQASEDGHARLPVELLDTADLERELQKRLTVIQPKITDPEEGKESDGESSEDGDAES